MSPKLAILGIAIAFLAGCGRSVELAPGPGDSSDELKRSPCACLNLNPPPPGPSDLERYRRVLPDGSAA